MRASIVLCAAALALGLGGCNKQDTSDSSMAPPMEQPSQTPPPAEATPAPPVEQPSTEVPPADQVPPGSEDSSGATAPPPGTPPSNQ